MSPFVLVSIAFSVFLVGLHYFIGSHMLSDQLRARVIDELQFLVYEFKEDGIAELLEEIDERVDKSQQSWRFLYAVQGPTGRWVFDALPSEPPLGWSQVKDSEYAQSTLLLTAELEGGYRLSVGLDESDLLSYGRTVLVSAGWLVAISTLVFVLISFYMYQRFSLIVKNLSVPVQEFSDGQFAVRIPATQGGPELIRLTENINAMFSQIEQLIAQLSSMSASLAHDLRTPLTRVKNNLTSLSGELGPEGKDKLHSIEQDFDKVLNLFGDVLQLHEIQRGGLQAHFVELNLSRLVDECVEMYQPLLEERSIGPHLNLEEDVMLHGSPALLKQVMVNLIENTLSHAVGCCKLEITLRLSSGKILLKVQDDGSSTIATSNQRHYGLGLKFVSAIIELHNGEVSYDQANNKGFCCTILLR